MQSWERLVFERVSSLRELIASCLISNMDSSIGLYIFNETL